MTKLVVFYLRDDENYFCGQYGFVEVGNTEKVVHMIGGKPLTGPAKPFTLFAPVRTAD